jgi:hypothetical protein
MPSAAAKRVRPTNRYQETSFIVIRKHLQPHVVVDGVIAPFRHVPRHGGYRVTLVGWEAAGMGRKKCANDWPRLLLQASAF